MFNLQNRGELDNATEREFENLNSSLKAMWSVQHNDDGTHNFDAMKIDASDIVSGVFDTARIPNLDASKITTGVLDPARIPSSITPSGVILGYGGSAAPTGWLLCDGTAVSRTTYASLFAVLSTTYGVGDGSTTFNIPDLRQRFPLGKAAAGTGSTLGSTGGSIDHTHVYTTVVAHTHTITDTGHTHTITDPGHIHAITDPGHTHDVQVNGAGGAGSVVQEGMTFSPVNVSAAALSHTTGITINSHSTGITGANSNTTGISVNSTGSASPSTQSANPPYVVINFIIKT